MTTKSYTVNYTNTLIQIADDSVNTKGVIPVPRAGKETIASRQYALLHKHPYKFTSDALLFQIHAERAGIPGENLAEEQNRFFSKPQACLRASPLPKKYGWGIHSDENGRIALVDSSSPTYQRLLQDDRAKKVKAMRSAREKMP